MRDLGFTAQTFDGVLAADNALPHLLLQADLESAVDQIAAKLTPEGVFIATVRDYDHLVADRPTMQPPAFFGDGQLQRFVHQVWRWQADQYTLHLYLTSSETSAAAWKVQHFHAGYRALLRSELKAALQRAGLAQIHCLEPAETGFYQPIVTAKR